MFGIAGWEEKKTRELLAKAIHEYHDMQLNCCTNV